MTPTARTLCFVVGMVLALPGASRAAVYGARVRWQPSGEPVAGYRVWVRPASGSYGAPREAGMPAMAGDGSYSLLVDGLDPRTDYAISVSAYTDTTTESAHSNELQIGYAQVAPVIDSDGDGLRDATEDPNLNRTVDAGETDPTRADTDGDGVGDAADRCAGTAAGTGVNAQGCACAQITCDDGNACNGVETCQAGVCGPGSSPSCDDGNPCTTDGCRAASGCTHTDVPSCSACTTDAQCNDGNACTIDTCSGGTCRNSAAADGTACGDGNACNGAETCQAGACRAGTALGCDDGNACTTDSCNPASGCTNTTVASCRTCTTNAQCDDGNACTTDTCSGGTCRNSAAADGTACGDGNACNGTETCRAGACAAGSPLSCDDGDRCTTDGCTPQAGCTHTPDTTCGSCPDAVALPPQGGTVTGQTTAGGTSRFSGSCEPTTAASPDTVYAWTPTVSGIATISTCGAATTYDTVLALRRGTCDAGEELGCNDDTDGCAVASGERLAGRHGSKITTEVTAGETYYIVVDGYAGRSGAFTMTVTPPVPCTVASCDDGNACTTDACGAGGCTHAPVDGCTSCSSDVQCQDADACNGAETCRAGRCTAAGAPLSCNDGNACTTDSCNAAAGCVHTSVAGCTGCSRDAQCADADPCTTDVCTAGRCEHPAAADGSSCADSNVCNGAETCRAGRCVAGRSLTCDDGNACTNDRCNATSGCTYAAVAGCDACTTAAECDDREACTADSCVDGRCARVPLADGASCTDGDFCNGLETCRAGHCAAGSTPDCDDGNACTTDTCDVGASQCTHASTAGCCTTDADCTDSDACTDHERCEEGVCVSDAVQCTEPGACQEAVCDPATGCATVAFPDGTACDDADPCTQNEQCTAGTCGAPSTAALTRRTGVELEASDFVLRRVSKRTWRLAATGAFAVSSDFDPVRSGLTFGILDESGTPLYQATVPAGAFFWRYGRYTYRAGESYPEDGLRSLYLEPSEDGVTVSVTARVPATVAVMPGTAELRRNVAASSTSRRLTWTMTLGDRCVRDLTVTCPTGRASSKRCR